MTATLRNGVRNPCVLFVIVSALAACGGEDDAAVTPAATSPAPTTASAPSNAGCDVVAQCFPQLAQSTLDRCPAAQLDARGRRVRRRLARLLEQIAEVDLHNSRAYETSDAVVATLAELERACLR